MNNALQPSSQANQVVARSQPSTPLQWLAPLLAGDSTSQEVALAILDKQRGLTPAKAQESPQVSALTKTEEGAIAASQALTNALLFTAAQFNVVRNMSDLQMAFLAEGLLELYWDWRFDEFLYVLREGVRQNWGKTYDRLDPPTMYEWCKAYSAARELQIENDALRAHDALKKAELLPPKPNLNSRAYYELRAKLDKLSNQELVNGEAYYQKKPNRTEEEEFKLFVATEMVNERRAAHYLAQIAQQLPPETASDRETEALAEARRVQLAVMRGDRAAAGLPASPIPGLYDNLPDAPAFGA